MRLDSLVVDVFIFTRISAINRRISAIHLFGGGLDFFSGISFNYVEPAPSINISSLGIPIYNQATSKVLNNNLDNFYFSTKNVYNQDNYPDGSFIIGMPADFGSPFKQFNNTDVFSQYFIQTFICDYYVYYTTIFSHKFPIYRLISMSKYYVISFKRIEFINLIYNSLPVEISERIMSNMKISIVYGDDIQELRHNPIPFSTFRGGYYSQRNIAILDFKNRLYIHPNEILSIYWDYNTALQMVGLTNNFVHAFRIVFHSFDYKKII